MSLPGNKTSNQNIIEVQLAVDPQGRLEARVRQRADEDVERILAMTDDEIYAEVIAEGKDPKEVGAEVRAILEDGIVKYRGRCMEPTIENRRELSAWMNERKDHGVLPIKGQAPEGAQYEDGTPITIAVNVAWRDVETGETFRIKYRTCAS